MESNWASLQELRNMLHINISTGVKGLCMLLLLSILVPAQGSLMSNIGGHKSNKHLIDLNEDNWRSMLKGEWVVEFYAPWCPACKNLATTWERYAITAADFDVKVAKIDVTTSPSLSGRFFVTALPTIYHVINGEFRQYRGSRDSDSLMFFIKQKQWQKIQPISFWKNPDSIHMSLLSYFFKLSHTLKDLNSRFQEEYGLPTWASYGLFALGTIFVGATLGLLLVCIVDLLYPPKKVARQSFSEAKDRDAPLGVEDIANDEIEDENDNEELDDVIGETSCEEEFPEQAEPEVEIEQQSTTPAPSQLLKEKIPEDNIDFKATEKVQTKKGSPTDVRKRKSRKAD